VGRSGTQGSIEGEIANLVTLRQASLNIAAALPIGLGAGAATGLLARQAVKLCIKAARGELL